MDISNVDTKLLAKQLDIGVIDINTDKDVVNYDYMFMWDRGRTKTVRLIKNISIEWIIKQVEKFKGYKNNNLINLFKTLNVKGDIYYTSFRLSYCTMFKSKDQFDADVNKIKRILDDAGIEYTNEFSDAHWVYRFRISQKECNLNRIQSIN